MIISQTNWIRRSTKKMDKPLRSELLECYRSSEFTPCFLRGIFNKIRYIFKRINVIVRFEDIPDFNDEESIRKVLKYRKIRKSRRLNKLNCYTIKLSPKQINNLLAIKSVKSLHLDRKVNALLDKAGPSINIPSAWETGLTGKGITTAVIDTGVYPHDDLTKPNNRLVGFKDFVNNRKDPYDDNGHGTHVAGDIASNGFSSGGLYKAPAYESNIVGVKVLNKFGTGNLSTIIQGIEWCIENKERYNIRTICLSLGTKPSDSFKDDILCEAVELAWNSGIVVCAAAGNEGPEAGSIDSPGIDPLIITVGAIDDRSTPDRSDDTIAAYSGRGPTIDNLNKPDLVCPGTNIISLRSPFSYIDLTSSSSRVGKYYINLSGTSMATPICCSSVALVLQKNPSLTPDQVKYRITGSCRYLSEYDVNVQGNGYIDIQKLLSLW